MIIKLLPPRLRPPDATFAAQTTRFSLFLLLIAALLALATDPAAAQSRRNQSPPPKNDNNLVTGGWVIVLELVPGEDAERAARERIGPISSTLSRTDISLQKRKNGVAIVLGRYDSPQSPRAQADLERVRNTVVSGRRPYAGAFLMPPPQENDPGRIPELNLANASRLFGKDALYTLQIGVYESPDKNTAKRAAEQAALALRSEGELAFYYHGPNRSMVTVGVFGDRDIDDQRAYVSPALRILRERYPLNLLNGQYPIIEKRPGQPDVKQPSTLVNIPT